MKSPDNNKFEISVIIPLYDKRVAEEICLNSWCNIQTLNRDLYEVIVLSDCTDTSAENCVRPLLNKHDRLIQCPNVNMNSLYHHGAKEARSSLLFFTELHCIAEPKCLEELIIFFEKNNALDGACIRSEPGCLNAFARVEARLFENLINTWSQPGNWRKVMYRGFAINRDAYFSAGGFDIHYKRFSDWILAANLHKNGAKLGYASKSCVLHYYNTSFSQFYPVVCEYAFDEYIYRSKNPEKFCNQYFGTDCEWSLRASFFPEYARDLCSIILKTIFFDQSTPQPKTRLKLLIPELLFYLPYACCGKHIILSIRRLKILWGKLCCWWWRKDDLKLSKSYLKTYGYTRDYCRMSFILNHKLSETYNIQNNLFYSMDELPDYQLIGLYPVEHWKHNSFRWARGAAIILVNLLPGSYRFAIDTLNVRGHYSKYLLNIYFNNHKITITSNNDTTQITGFIDYSFFEKTNKQKFIITSIPLNKKQKKLPDSRSMGVPISNIRFIPQSKYNHDRPSISHAI